MSDDDARQDSDHGSSEKDGKLHAPSADSELQEEHDKAAEPAADAKSPEEPSGTARESEPSSKSPTPASGTAEESASSHSAAAADSAAENASATPDPGAPDQSEWQAVWAPTYNAYYFYNSRTGETTWTNPLHPQSSTSAAPAAESSLQAHPAETSVSSSAFQWPSAYDTSDPLQGIDPLLARLDPTLIATNGPTGEYTASARFNAHTGRFEADPTKNPERMSEYERMKRMSEVYFDTAAWEKEVEERKEQERVEGGKRKRPSKKDLERFAEQRKRKKIAKTAWLRN